MPLIDKFYYLLFLLSINGYLDNITYYEIMINGINTSLSGLLAASTRASTAANNIVNAYNTSTPVGGDSSTAAIRTSRAYVPHRTINSSQK